MIVNLRKSNEAIINNLSKEEHYVLQSVDLAYSELKNHNIMAMLLGHGVEVLNIEICETECVESVVALMLSAGKLNIEIVETCNSSFEILALMYPEKKALLRRAKMLGKNLLEVVTNA